MKGLEGEVDIKSQVQRIKTVVIPYYFKFLRQ